MQNLMQGISFKTLDDKLAVMFGDKAQKIAQKLDGDIKTTQFRKFYDKVLELNDKAQSLDESEFDTQIKPFVKMLTSKVAYSKTRKLSKDGFVILMQKSIDKVDSQEELQNFKYFLESIIGFMPKK
jgi:CRISPR-associated protein Csm2